MSALLLNALGWVPLWGWIAIGALVLGAVTRYIRVVGWQGALGSLLAIAALALYATGIRQGKEQREKEGYENVKVVMDKARKARERSAVDNADPDRLRDDDGYRRPE